MPTELCVYNITAKPFPMVAGGVPAAKAKQTLFTSLLVEHLLLSHWPRQVTQPSPETTHSLETGMGILLAILQIFYDR